MDHYLEIIILGIVEGVTEFLPISSTGHLLIAEHLLGTDMPDVFNVVIQAGAILAVVFIYWHKITELLGSLDKPESRSYFLKLVAAFVVTCVIGYVAMDKLHLKLPETLAPVAWATLIGGLVIFAVEAFAKHLYPHEDVSWPEAILIGIAQIVAGIFPGTSRSGATIMTGMTMGMKRTTATEFSFLVGIPTMFAASAHELVKYRKDLSSGGHQLLLDIVVGFFVSLVVAFFVVKWLLRFIQTHTFNGFAIYRVLLGGGLLIAIAYNPSLAEIGKEAPKTKAPVEVTPIPNTAPAPDATNTITPVPITNAVTTPIAPAGDTNAAPVMPMDAPSTPKALPVNLNEMTNADIMPAAPKIASNRPLETVNQSIIKTTSQDLLNPAAINQPVFKTHKVATHSDVLSQPTTYTSGQVINGAAPVVPNASLTNLVVAPTQPTVHHVTSSNSKRGTTITVIDATPAVVQPASTNILTSGSIVQPATNSAPANVPVN